MMAPAPPSREAVAELSNAITTWVDDHYSSNNHWPTAILSPDHKKTLDEFAPRRERRTWSEALLSRQDPSQIIKKFLAAILTHRMSIHCKPEVSYPFISAELLALWRKIRVDSESEDATKNAWRAQTMALMVPLSGQAAERFRHQVKQLVTSIIVELMQWERPGQGDGWNSQALELEFIIQQAVVLAESIWSQEETYAWNWRVSLDVDKATHRVVFPALYRPDPKDDTWIEDGYTEDDWIEGTVDDSNTVAAVVLEKGV
jgi:hypothetical protein